MLRTKPADLWNGAAEFAGAAHFHTSSIGKPSRSLEPKLNREDNRLAV
jgi:hypothetical protein